MNCIAHSTLTCAKRCCFLLIVLTGLTISSQASITYTTTMSWSGCPTTVAKNKTTYSSWEYVDAGGVHHYFNGSDYKEVRIKYVVAGHITYCGIDQTTSLNVTSTDGVYKLKATGNIGSVSPVTVSGFVNPKYIVVGVTYAPPGPSSNVSYENTKLVGNTTKITSGFASGHSLSVSASADISAWSVVGGASVKVTMSESTEYTQTSGTSQEITISKETGVKYTTNGTGDSFNPVNHDYDTIWLWLNPLALFSIDLSNPAAVQWNGYGYDKNDMNGPDVYPVLVGWLNGHFGTNPSVQSKLARSWVTTTEPGMVWPVGEGPGLTTSDINNILLADPFTGGNYTLPNPLPSTSADSRFTQITYPPNPIAYEQAGPGNGGGTTTGYDAVHVNTSIYGQNASHEFKQTFGIQSEFKGGTWFGKFTVDIDASQSFTWTHSWEHTLTTTDTMTKAISITGPPCAQTSLPCIPTYAGPPQFIVYQDNLYGTFMFYPVQ